MRGLTASELVELWDRAGGLGHASRALAVLAAGEPGASNQVLEALAAGERDARLLALRARTFGPRLEVLAACPECGAPVELAFAAGVEDPGAPSTPEPVTRELAGTTVVLRPVTAGDLVAAESALNLAEARGRLLRRCVLAVDGEQGAPIPDQLSEAVESALEALDREALSEIATTCPECDHAWSLPFDPARFLWQEIESHVRRLLAEVAALAGRYHWAERDILAMSAARRRFYLEASG